MTLIETRNDVLLLVGREDFSPPRSFGGATAVSTHDCVAFAVGGGPVTVELTPVAAPGLQDLGEFVIEAEGLLSLRDVWNKEYDAAGVHPGPDPGLGAGRRRHRADPRLADLHADGLSLSGP